MHTALIEPLESRITPASIIITAIDPVQAEGNNNGGFHQVLFNIQVVLADGEELPGAVMVDYFTVSVTASADEDYEPVVTPQTVTLQAANQYSQQISINVREDLEFELDETFSVQLSNPQGAELGTPSSAEHTIQNDDDPPVINVTPIHTPEGNETNTQNLFRIELSKNVGVEVTVRVRTIGGTAESGIDYTEFDQIITFEPGVSTKFIPIEILGDTNEEDDETITLEISEAVNATIGTPQVDVTIQDDDGPPGVSLSIADATVSESAGVMVFNVTRSGPLDQTVTVDFATVEGSARVSDFVSKTGTLTFAAGETVKTISVSIISDNTHELTETFTVELSNPSTDVTITNGTATGTITDDDPVPVLTIVGPDGLTAAVNEGDTASENRTITLRLDRPTHEPVTVRLVSSDGTAIAGTDYTAINQSVTFAAGETSKTVTLTVVGDMIDELDTQFTLAATLEAGVVTLPVSPLTFTIRNDDRNLTVSADQTLTETAAGTNGFRFTVTLDQESDHVISFTYRTVDVTATSSGPGADYTAHPLTTVTFQPGETEKEIFVEVNDDNFGEADEVFRVEFTEVQHATINKFSVEGTIVDDDPFVSISNARVIEGAAGTSRTAVFTVQLLRGAQAVSMNYMTQDLPTGPNAAKAGEDYVAKSGTLSFGPNETSKTIEVTVLGDNVGEADENFLVTLQDFVGFGVDPAGGATLSATGTIVDDEGLVTVADAFVVEGDTGTTNMVFTLNLARGPITGNVKVDYSFTDGTAISTGSLADYTATPGSVTFTTGQTSQTISVPVRGDLLHEGTQTFTLNLSIDNTGVQPDQQASLERTTATGTIFDNDPAPRFTISSSGSVLEDAPDAAVEFMVTLIGGSDVPITVNFATQDGTATAGADYTTTTQLLTFAPGETSKPVLVPVLADTLAEGDETFLGVLSNASGGATITTASATGTILDDDIVVSLDALDFAGGAVSEGGGTKKMRVTLSQALASGTVTVNFALTPTTTNGATEGVDYTLVGSKTLTFAPGDPLSKDIEFNIINDTLHETDETFIVTLTSATNAVLNPSQLQVTAGIADDDAAPTISINDVQITEGNSGTQQMNFTVRLSGPSGQPISVTVTPTPGTATTPGDFTTGASTITFAAGETVKTVPINIVGDTVDEQTETFTMVLSNPTNGATIADGTGVGTIFDNDTRTLSIADASVVEGQSGTTTMTFLVTLSSTAAQTITIDYVTANGTATAGSDYVGVTTPGTLVFEPGQTSKEIEITVNGDTEVEGNETFFVRLQPKPGTPVNALIVDGEAVGTIQADESEFSIDTTLAVQGVEEGASSGVGNLLTFIIKRTGDLTLPGSVSYTTVDGTAKSSGARPDYVAANGTVNFAANAPTATVQVRLIDDLHFEGDETFTLRLTGATGGILGATTEQQATILGSDSRPSVQITNAQLLEGNDSTDDETPLPTMTFTVTLRAGLDGPITANELETTTVSFETLDGTAQSTDMGVFLQDFIAQTGTLTFAPGETTKTIAIKIVGDTIDEFDETFTVKLSDAMAGTTALTLLNDTGVGTIVDDDEAPVLRFMKIGDGAANGDISVAEGPEGTEFTVRPVLQLLDAGGNQVFSAKPITLTITTVPGTATLGDDFRLPAGFGLSQSVTIEPGQRTASVNYTIIGDGIHEANETFDVVVSNVQNATVGDDRATVTIANDDPLPQLVVNGASIVEPDSGQANLVFTVSLLGASDRTVTVNFATADGTAKSTGALIDYLATTGTLSFAPGETTKTVAVPVLGDTWAEDDETFTLALSGQTNATILAPNATGTILNGNDTIVGLVVSDARSVENPVDSNGSPVTNPVMNFRVELTKTIGTAVTFLAQTRNGTAISGSDYTALNATQFTIAANTSSVDVPVGIIPDTIFETSESFFLGVGAVSGGVQEARGEGRGVILNDDFAFVDANGAIITSASPSGAAKTLVYVDEDGDLATLKITKGDLRSATITLSQVNQTTGGRTLQLIDFTGNPALFNGTDVRITVAPQAGFAASGLTTDGQVDVGFIRGAIPDPNTLRFDSGIDFGSIVVPGDVGKIVAGDSFTTPAIRGSITVESLGARGTETGAPDNISEFLSVVNSVKVAGDVEGVIKVIGGNLGSINSLQIGGALLGDATPANSTVQSGIVFFTGTLGKATIGSIIGGANPDSGKINGNTDFVAKIGTLRVLGDIVGGAGARSGHVVAKTIGAVTVDGSIIGGGVANDPTDTNGNLISSNSGEILATRAIGSVKIGGDVRGGIQSASGLILSGGTLGSVRIGGSLIGGSGAVDTGVVTANQALGTLTILGDIVGSTGERSGTVQVGGSITKVTLGSTAGGGNLRGGAGEDSGTISAGAGFRDGAFGVFGGNISSALIYGDIVGGSGDGSTTQTGNGSGGVQAGNQIVKLDVRGSLMGGDSPGAKDGTAAREMTQSGFVTAGRLGQVIVGGDVIAGQDGGGGLADSGSIRARENIGSLTIRGNVIGNADTRVVISAGNNGPLVNGVLTPAIGTLTIGTAGNAATGNAFHLDVLAGYGDGAPGTADEPLGAFRTPDAQIGTVTIRRDVLATNIVAGAEAGIDGEFGTADDAKLEGSIAAPLPDAAKVFSSIAKVIIGGTVLPNDQSYGIVAERIAAVTVAGSALSLNVGRGNDFEVDLGDDTLMKVNELSATT